MKLLQVTAHYPPKLGGAQRRIKDLSEKLFKKGHNVSVFTSNIGCKNKKVDSSKRNIHVKYLKSWEFAHTPIIPSLGKQLMTARGDLMHIHIAQAMVPEVASKIARKRNIPYICHIRGDPPASGFFGFLLPLYKKIFLKRVLKKADRIICLNEDYKKLFSRKYNLPLSKIVVIPNATDFEIVKKIKKRKVKKILFVGRFTSEKNIHSIISSLRLLKNTKVQLILVGEGPDLKKLKEIVRQNRLTGRVEFTGRLEGVNLYKKYLEADLFILPSTTECFSSTLLESMATATPIIASDIPGTRNVIKHGYNGLLVKPTPSKIAEAIEKLIKNKKLREKLAKNGLKEVKKYSWDKILEQTEQVYREVLKEHATKTNKK